MKNGSILFSSTSMCISGCTCIVLEEFTSLFFFFFNNFLFLSSFFHLRIRSAFYILESVQNSFLLTFQLSIVESCQLSTQSNEFLKLVRNYALVPHIFEISHKMLFILIEIEDAWNLFIFLYFSSRFRFLS